MKKLKAMLALVSLPMAVMSASAAQIPQRAKQPIYTITINVVDRTTKAINYQHRNGATKIDFRGTPLLPAAHGEAKVESKQGYIEIEVEFRNLQPATRFGLAFQGDQAGIFGGLHGLARRHRNRLVSSVSRLISFSLFEKLGGLLESFSC